MSSAKRHDSAALPNSLCSSESVPDEERSMMQKNTVSQNARRESKQVDNERPKGTRWCRQEIIQVIKGSSRNHAATLGHWSVGVVCFHDEHEGEVAQCLQGQHCHQ